MHRGTSTSDSTKRRYAERAVSSLSSFGRIDVARMPVDGRVVSRRYFTGLSVYLYICLSIISHNVFSPVHWFVNPFSLLKCAFSNFFYLFASIQTLDCLTVCLSICLFISRLSCSMSLCLSVCLLSKCWFVNCESVQLSIHGLSVAE
jgi:hypothetical protein